ncbi:MAG: TonB-dependent receptor plug domain-containing protein [Gemmatimonadetes bacterium]|nr:TonB-dependent receptor plug domain-containing protein [Gemmatimonadota bacterium]MYB68217.1 TonB-dependent receptor plug domain-containing protein [Gemmatimonadota bacterium]
MSNKFRFMQGFYTLCLSCATILQFHTIGEAATLTVTALDSLTKEPVNGVFVNVAGSPHTSITDIEGKTRLELAPGHILVQYSHIAYSSGVIQTHLDSLGSTLLILLQTHPVEIPEVIISTSASTPEQGKTDISLTELRRYPAPTNDPLRYLKVLPGITSGNDFSELYNVQGGNYDQNLVYINGVEMESPLLLRRGLAQTLSILNPTMIDSMTFRAISFPVTFGDKLSSALDANYKLNAQENGGILDLSVTTQSLTLQGHLAQSLDFISGIRYSNLGRNARGLQISGQFDRKFWDWQTQIRFKYPRIGQLTLYIATLRSIFGMRPEEILLRYNCHAFRHERICDEYHGFASGHENFTYEDNLLGMSMERTAKHGRIRVYTNIVHKREDEDTSVQYEIEPSSIRSTEAFINQLKQIKVESAIVASKDLGESHFTVGVGARFLKLNGSINSFEGITYDRGRFFAEGINSELQRNYNDSFFYLQSRHQTGRLRTVGGVRIAQFGATGETIVMPRISANYRLFPRVSWTLAAGRHAQPPVYKEFLPVGSAKDSLKSQRSDQIGTGLIYQIQESLYWSTEIFYRSQWRMISYQIDDLRIRYSGENDSKGRVFGVNSKLRGKLDSLIGIVSYGYLIAQENIVRDGYDYLPRANDQRHTLSMYLEDRMFLDFMRIRFLDYSRFHIRVLYGTGFPHTPKVVAISEDGHQQLTDGPRNSVRDRPYFRFDVGMTQSTSLWRKTLHLREEIANVFDQHNVLGYSYLPSSSGKPIELRKSLGRRVYNVSVSVEF